MEDISPLDAMVANHAPIGYMAAMDRLELSRQQETLDVAQAMDKTMDAHPPGPEILDDSAERNDLGKLLDQLKLLASIDQSMLSSGKVHRGQVKELVEHCSVALDSRYPVASFTQAPSSMNYAVACESVAQRAGQIALDIIKHAGELIMKIIRWIIDAVKRLSGRSRVIRQRVIYTLALHDASNMAAATVTMSAASPQAKKVLDDAVETYRAQSSQLTTALLNESALLGLLKSLSLLLPRIATLVEQKTEYGEKTLTTVQDVALMSQALSTLAQPLPMEPLHKLSGAYPSLLQAPLYVDYFEELKRIVTDLHNTPDPKPMDWNVALKVAIDPRSGFDEPLVALPDVIGRQFEQLSSRLHSLMNPKIKAAIDSRLASVVDQAMISLVGDIHSLMFYVETVNLTLDTQAMTADTIYRCALAQFELYRSAAETSQNPEWVEAINAVQKTLRESIINRK